MSGECDDGFQLVSKRKAARGSHKNAYRVNYNVPFGQSNETTVSRQDVLDRIESCRKDILRSDFWKNFLGTVKEAKLLPPAKDQDEKSPSPPLMNGYISEIKTDFMTNCSIHPEHGKCDIDNTLPVETVNLLPLQAQLACDSCTNEPSSLESNHTGKEPVNFEDKESNAQCLQPEKDHAVHCTGSKTETTVPENYTDSLEVGSDCQVETVPITNGATLPEPSCTDCKSVRNHPGDIAHLVCYGLGRFATCHIAKHQLAFLLAIRDQFKICGHHCHVYDPVFNEVELDVLRNLGCNIITCNEEGKRQVSDKTLFFMPHCGTPLYNNLLWANWSVQNLPHVTVLGNSFGTIESRTPSRVLQSEARFMAKVFPHVREHTVKNNFRHSDIFNELSLHSFDARTLRAEPLDFWADALEPIYPNNVEIIQNKPGRKWI